MQKVIDYPIRSYMYRFYNEGIKLPEECLSPSVSPDQRFAVYLSRQEPGGVWIYDHHGALIAHFVISREVVSPVISPDSDYIVFADRQDCEVSSQKDIWIYDKFGRLIKQFKTPEECGLPEIRPDSKYAFFSNWQEDGRVWIYETKNWEIVKELRPFTKLSYIYFSLDSEFTLYTRSIDGGKTKVKIYDRKNDLFATFVIPGVFTLIDILRPSPRIIVIKEGFFSEDPEYGWYYDLQDKRLIGKQKVS